MIQYVILGFLSIQDKSETFKQPNNQTSKQPETTSLVVPKTDVDEYVFDAECIPVRSMHDLVVGQDR
jgi:hypothetical protein